MLKEYWFKTRNKRTERVSETILDDLRWFLDLNLVSEEASDTVTAELYDADELSQETEAERILHVEDECIDEFLCEKCISAFKEAPEPPRAPASFSRRRGLPPFPPLKREEKAKRDSSQTPQLQQQSLEDVISALGRTFQQQLLGLIDAKGYTDSQVYRKANLDRKLFSKIRCNKDYKPSKLTALSQAIALELNLDEATDLLERAGLALSPSNLTDMIIKYCITHQIYDIYDVNALLYEHDQQLLGC